jgi:nitrogen-specific signal transduction histidine kinase
MDVATRNAVVALLDALPFAAMLVDDDGRVLIANRTAAEIAPDAARDAGRFRTTTHALGSSLEGLSLVLVERSSDAADGSGPVDPIDETLARLAHEINNPLMVLLGSAELLLGQSDLSASSRDRVAAILDQARRVRERIDRLVRLKER